MLIWRNATDIPKEKQALALMLRLTGRPAALARAVSLSAYTKDSGVGNLLDFPRRKFGQSPIYLIHQDLKAFFGIRRTEASVTEFLDRFQMSRSQVENRTDYEFEKATLQEELEAYSQESESLRRELRHKHDEVEQLRLRCADLENQLNRKYHQQRT